MWPFKKPKIEFFNVVPQIAELMPIIPAAQYFMSGNPQWFHRCAAEYRRLKKDEEWCRTRNVHTARCPGIHQILSHGWVMRTYQDFTIKTYTENDPTLPEGEDYRGYFTWTSATTLPQKGNTKVDDLISYHHYDQYGTYFNNWDDGYLKSTLKLQMNWRALIPPGYMLLEQPYPYPDHHDFKAFQGVYYPEYGAANLNLQLLVRRTGKHLLIPAGTPVALYMCIPKQDIDFDVRAATPADQLKDNIGSLGYIATFGKTAGSQLVRKQKIFKP